jgi:hypothetical protein
VRSLPSTEILSSKLYSLPRLVSWVYLRVHDMCLMEGDGEQVVNMCWEALETCLVAHEAMNIQKQQSSTAIVLSLLGRD